MREKAFIFHHPLPLLEKGRSGSRVRPRKMLNAFRELGYEAEVVAGYSRERLKSVARVKGQMRKGREFAFLYSESSTMPTLLTDPRHFPLHPFLDFGFFRFLKGEGVPLGLYYRDVHWRFQEYRERVNLFKRSVAIPFYRYDWKRYEQWVDHLFLPSLAMKKALPGKWPEERVSALPPGCGQEDAAPAPDHPGEKALSLLYVGGILPPLYDLREMCRSIAGRDGINLTLCCRKEEWEAVKTSYHLPENGNVRILHGAGSELSDIYGQADAFLLTWLPHPYLEFAMPVKLFEALGYGLPVITRAGTETARFVEEEKVGWVVREEVDLRYLLERLASNRAMIEGKRKWVRGRREKHLWVQRASEAAEILTGIRSDV